MGKRSMNEEQPRSTQTTDVTPEFKALVDAIIAAGHTCQSVLVRLDKRIDETAPGPGRDNLVSFRQQLVEKIKNGQ